MYKSSNFLLIIHVQVNAHVEVSSRPRVLNFGPSLHLHPCTVYAAWLAGLKDNEWHC